MWLWGRESYLNELINEFNENIIMSYRAKTGQIQNKVRNWALIFCGRVQAEKVTQLPVWVFIGPLRKKVDQEPLPKRRNES